VLWGGGGGRGGFAGGGRRRETGRTVATGPAELATSLRARRSRTKATRRAEAAGGRAARRGRRRAAAARTSPSSSSSATPELARFGSVAAVATPRSRARGSRRRRAGGGGGGGGGGGERATAGDWAIVDHPDGRAAPARLAAPRATAWSRITRALMVPRDWEGLETGRVFAEAGLPSRNAARVVRDADRPPPLDRNLTPDLAWNRYVRFNLGRCSPLWARHSEGRESLPNPASKAVHFPRRARLACAENLQSLPHYREISSKRRL